MGDWIQAQSLPVNMAIGLAALAVLVLSADYAVSKLIGLANYFHLSTTFMGMTVLSLATSIPEISAHLTASVGILRGTLDYEIGSAIVLGANIGSDVVQQTLILAVVVFYAGLLYFRRYFLWKSLMPLILTALLCLVLGWDHVYSRLDGLILFTVFVAYTYYLYVDERKHYQAPEAEAGKDEDEIEVEQEGPQTPLEAVRYALLALGSMVFTVGAAQVVLGITETVVQTTGIGGSFIGVITLGVASALPELTTAVSGVRRNEHGVSLGTLVGSNITNPLVAIGLGALVSTYAAPRPFLYWDLPAQAVTGAILWVVLLFSKGRLTRRNAYYLIVMYVLYIALRALFFLTD